MTTVAIIEETHRTLHPLPARSGTLSIDLWRVDVTLSYDPGTLTLIDSKLRDVHDRVSKVKDGKATVQFGKIAQDDARSATLIFRVNTAVANGAPIQAAAAYHWWAADADDTGTCRIDNVIAVSTNVAAPAFIAPDAGPPARSTRSGRRASSPGSRW